MQQCSSHIKHNKKSPHNFGVSKVRECALLLLHSVFCGKSGDAPLASLLAGESAKFALSDVDSSLLSELVYGVLRHACILDGALTRFLPRPDSLSRMIRHLLRLGAYELIFMPGIPPHASVNELTGLARHFLGERSAGLVNAVLRKTAAEYRLIFDDIHEWLLSLGESSSPIDIAHAGSIPLWLAQQWVRQYGALHAVNMARSLTQAPAACWRINFFRPGAQAVLNQMLSLGAAPCGSHGFCHEAISDAAHDTGIDVWNQLVSFEKAGIISRQGTSSQLVAEAVANRLRSRCGLIELWDCCCGRGGKTSALMEQGVHVALATDPSSRRVADLQMNFHRLGLPLPEIKTCRAQDVTGIFSAILLDAPCSGTGTLARNPEIKFRITKNWLDFAVDLQKDILCHAWNNLSSDGQLFYVTCAYNADENELQVDRFIKHHRDAVLESSQMFLPQIRGQDSLYLAILHKR